MEFASGASKWSEMDLRCAKYKREEKKIVEAKCTEIYSWKKCVVKCVKALVKVTFRYTLVLL